jgi:hypothetical protein
MAHLFPEHASQAVLRPLRYPLILLEKRATLAQPLRQNAPKPVRIFTGADIVSFFWHARALLEPWLPFIVLSKTADCFSSQVFSSFSIIHFFSQASSAPSGIAGWCFQTREREQVRFLPPRHVSLL